MMLSDVVCRRRLKGELGEELEDVDGLGIGKGCSLPIYYCIR